MISLNKIVLSLASVSALAASLPALAGPDWTVIERARAQKQAQARRASAQARCPLQAQGAAAPAAPSAVPAATA
ncbi:hypothetical protein, partial [Cupriavidus sp. M-11]